MMVVDKDGNHVDLRAPGDRGPWPGYAGLWPPPYRGALTTIGNELGARPSGSGQS